MKRDSRSKLGLASCLKLTALTLFAALTPAATAGGQN
jgi:hypothetical protein